MNMEHAGVYDVIITDAFGQTLGSQPATVEIGLAPAITQQPLDINATMGSTVLFSMEANGTQPLTYQWQKRDSNSSVFVDIPGAQAPALSFTGVDLNRIGAYRATVTNPYGQATTQFAQLNVGQAPVITKDVHDLFAAEGSTTGWTVEVNGTAPFTYRWRKDNQDLEGTDGPTLTINDVNASHWGIYEVFVSNAYGTVRSAQPALLLVGQAPVITQQPTTLYAARDTNASFTMSASGSPDLNYQWYRNGTLLPDGNGTNYLLNQVQPHQVGEYHAVVSNHYGNATSQIANLHVGDAPLINIAPTDVIAAIGSATQLSVDANGTGPLAYQWHKNGNNVTDANGTVLAFPNVQNSDEGVYEVTVSSPYGSVRSGPANLQIGRAPQFTTQPLDHNASIGSNLTLSVDANGSGPLTFEWFKGTQPLPDANGSKTLTINNVSANDAGNYKVHVANEYGSIDSRVALIAVGYAPVLTRDLTPDQFIVAGTAINLSVDVNGSAPLTYAWTHDGNSITEANGSTHTIASAALNHAGVYQVNVSNPFGQVAGQPVSINVGYPPVYLTELTDQNATTGDNITFTADVNGTAPITFQWYRETAPISSATNQIYQIPNATSQNNGRYWVKASNLYGIQDSRQARLDVGGPPVIIVQPDANKTATGSTLTLSVEVSGSEPLTYQWYHNNGALSGATEKTLIINDVNGSHNGAYFVRVSNSRGVAESQVVEILVGDAPKIAEQPVSKKTVKDQATFLSVKISNPEGANANWTKDGIAVTNSDAFGIIEYSADYSTNKRKWFKTTGGGWCFLTPEGKLARRSVAADWNATLWSTPQALIGHQILFIRRANNEAAGIYKAVVQNTFGSTPSATATLEVESPPTITQHPQSLSIAKDGNATFNVTASGTNITYQWQKDGVSLAGETNSTLTIQDANGSDSGQYSVAVSNEHGSVISQPATLVVQVPPVIVLQPTGQEAVKGNNVKLTVRGQGGENLIYTWKKNGVDQGHGIQITEHLQQFDSIHRKWLKNAQGNWCFINPQGQLFQNGKPYHVGVEFWTNPAGLIGPNMLILNNVSAAEAGSYVCVVSNQFGSLTSQTAVVNVHAPPVITAQPVSVLIDLNSTATFTVQTGGVGLSYQWFKDGLTISNETNSTLTIHNANTSNMGEYRCRVSNNYGAITSEKATLALRIPPVFTGQPADVNGTNGQNKWLRVKVSSPLAVTYQWQKDSANLPASSSVTLAMYVSAHDSAKRKWLRDDSGRWGFITPEGVCRMGGKTIHLGTDAWNNPANWLGWNYLPLNSMNSSHAGNYKCVATSSFGSATSDEITVNVTSPPHITKQPEDISVVKGNSATFTLEASGTGMTFQWRKDGTLISGATTSSYTIADSNSSDAGTYTCTITNTHGSTVSRTATLVVIAPPTFVQHPVDTNGTANQPVTLFSRATGSGTVNYSWEYSSNDGNYTAVAIGETFVIQQLAPQYNTTHRKWFKDNLGGWGYITPQGNLYRRGRLSSIGVQFWNTPEQLTNLAVLTLPAPTSANTGYYRAKASNESGTTASGSKLLTIQ